MLERARLSSANSLPAAPASATWRPKEAKIFSLNSANRTSLI